MFRFCRQLRRASMLAILILPAVVAPSNGQEMDAGSGQNQTSEYGTGEGASQLLWADSDSAPELVPVPAKPLTQADQAQRTKVVTWQSPEFFHRTLVFEEPDLERFGYSSRPRTQSLISGVRFVSRAAIYPFYRAK